jgi:hypothetical protein
MVLESVLLRIANSKRDWYVWRDPKADGCHHAIGQLVPVNVAGPSSDRLCITDQPYVGSRPSLKFRPILVRPRQVQGFPARRSCQLDPSFSEAYPPGRCHGRRSAKRLVDAPEVVAHQITRERVAVVLELLGEPNRKAPTPR